MRPNEDVDVKNLLSGEMAATHNAAVSLYMIMYMCKGN